MRSGTLILAAVVLLTGCTTNTDKRIPRAAADAMTGSPATLTAIGSLTIVGVGENFNLGQNPSPEADLPRFVITSFKRSMVFNRRQWRQEQTRLADYPTANVAPQRQITALDGNVAFNVNATTGVPTRLSNQIAADRGAEIYHHPIGYLMAVFNESGQMSNSRVEDGMDAVDMLVDGRTYTLFNDATTALPRKIVSVGYNVNLGDIVIETMFDDYMPVLGHQLPGRITTSVDGRVTADIRIEQQFIGGNVGDLASPEEVATAEAPEFTANVTSEQVGDGVWYLTGQSHHSVVVEFGDHLTLIEAPQNEVRSLAVIEAARALRPEKPLTEVVNTHHHFDHSGGIRAAVSEGLTIVTHEANREFYEDVVRRPHTVIEDALSRDPQPLNIETVDGSRVFEDATRRLEIYVIEGNPHAETLLMVYLPAEGLLIEADVFTPPVEGPRPAQRFPFAPNLADNIQRNNLNVARFLPIHGAMAPAQTLQVAVAQEIRMTQ